MAHVRDRVCTHCDEPFVVTYGQKKPGLYNSCWTCCKDEEKGIMKLKGVMHYGHKTAGEIVIMHAADAEAVIKAGQRNSGHVLSGIVQNKQ